MNHGYSLDGLGSSHQDLTNHLPHQFSFNSLHLSYDALIDVVLIDLLRTRLLSAAHTTPPLKSLSILTYNSIQATIFENYLPSIGSSLETATLDLTIASWLPCHSLAPFTNLTSVRFRVWERFVPITEDPMDVAQAGIPIQHTLPLIRSISQSRTPLSHLDYDIQLDDTVYFENENTFWERLSSSSVWDGLEEAVLELRDLQELKIQFIYKLFYSDKGSDGKTLCDATEGGLKHVVRP